jgi:NADP-dependent 3-hydroxy acid dehydrogenase YdfG
MSTLTPTTTSYFTGQGILDLWPTSSGHQPRESDGQPTPKAPLTSQKGLILIGPGEHFGFEIAKKFGLEHFQIGLVGRSSGKLLSTVEELCRYGIDAFYVCADVTNENEVKDAFQQIKTKMLRPECLIYNVKSSVKGTGLSLKPSDLTLTMAANISGAVSAIQSVSPFFCHASSPMIILTGGGYKDTPNENKLSLSVGKAGIHMVAKVTNSILDRRGIKIRTLVIDGVVRDDGPLRSADVAEEFWKIYEFPPAAFTIKYSSKTQQLIDAKRDHVQLSFFS